jgi:mannosylglucosylglycerate synthase
VEAVLRRHAGLLAEHGYPVRVIAGRGQAWDSRIALDIIPLLDSQHPDILAAKHDLDAGRVPDGFEALIARIRAALAGQLGAIDLLLAHNVCSLHKNLALTAALHDMHRDEGRPRMVLWHHDLAWTAAAYRGELHAGWPWDLLASDWGAEHVVVSEARGRQLIDLMHIDPARVTVIPNGVDAAQLLKLSAETQAIVDAFGLLQADPILLTPVRITRRKNLELALRASAILRESFPRLALLVTGPPGPHNPANRRYLDELRTLRAELGLEGHTHFLAEGQPQPLSDEAIGDLYRVADVLLLPSREEGFGIPLLEASLARLPIFCSDIPALRELGAEGADYFSPDATPAEVAQLIATRLQADRAYGMTVRARQSYGWQQVFVEHIEPLVQR